MSALTENPVMPSPSISIFELPHWDTLEWVVTDSSFRRRSVHCSPPTTRPQSPRPSCKTYTFDTFIAS